MRRTAKELQDIRDRCNAVMMLSCGALIVFQELDRIRPVYEAAKRLNDSDDGRGGLNGAALNELVAAVAKAEGDQP